MTGKMRHALRWSPCLFLVAAIVACVTGLLTGKADHVSGGTYGMPPPIVNARMANRLFQETDGVRPWRFTRTPQGRHAAISLTGDGHLSMMVDLDGDPRYFAIVLQQDACRGGEIRGAMLETMQSGNYRRHEIRLDTGPWFGRQVSAECRRNDGTGHVHATQREVMTWFMHVLPGEKYALHTVENAPSEKSVLDLVMGSPPQDDAGHL